MNFKFKLIWKSIGKTQKRKKYRKVKRKSGILEYAKYKSMALKIAEDRIAHFNAFYQFNVNRITIKNQKTRWGSCSKKGNLNFNYRIAILPQALSDYIIVHELCHLGEFNHSPKFWNLVAKTLPEYKKFKKDFKKLVLP